MMPFRLSNILASFQGYINKILANKLKVFILVYLDDILIYIKNKGQGYVKAVWLVLNLLKKNVFFANLKKCWFHQNKACFLKYILSAHGI